MTSNASEQALITYMRYSFYQADQTWRVLPVEAREVAKRQFVQAIEKAEADTRLQVYSTTGTRSDCDLCIWQLAERPDPFFDLAAGINSTQMAPYLRMTHSYFALSRKSPYTPGRESQRRAAGPTGKAYLFVYPMWKKREWYRLPFEWRKRMMAEHFLIGRRFPQIEINTGYSFGLDDQEFVVSFEADDPADFLALVEELRGSEASVYTEWETPIFTCRLMGPAQTVDLLGGNL